MGNFNTDVHENNSGVDFSNESKEMRKKNFFGKSAHFAFVGSSVVSGLGFLLLFVALCELVAVQVWGVPSSKVFIKTYPNSNLVYFDVFGYILNLRTGFDYINRNMFSTFTGFPVISFSDWISGIKALVNMFSVAINTLFLPIKFILVYPLQAVQLVLGFSVSDGLSSFLSNLASWMVPYWF